MPEVKKMTTRRSARNLQQLSTQSQNVQSDEEPVRDYELNCGRAMKKKAKTCSVDSLVTGEEKGGNHVYSFSTSMYEIYRTRLI